MSMELWVLSDKRLNSVTEWQAAIDVEKYPLKLAEEQSFENLNGFLPSELRGELTGFECYHDDVGEFMQNNAGLTFGHEWKYVLGLRWLGSKETETLAAWMAGTAYARATDGIVANDQDSELRTAAQSADVVRETEHPSRAYQEARRELRRRRGLE